MRPWDHVHANQFTHSSRGCCACVRRGFDCANIAAHEHGHVTGTDVFFSEQLHVRRFDHRVGRFDRADEAFGLDHSQCFKGHFCILTLKF
jgi:hypothetical protein